jgi:hypothetical protein
MRKKQWKKVALPRLNGSLKVRQMERERAQHFENSYGDFLRSEGLLKKGQKVPMPDIFP